MGKSVDLPKLEACDGTVVAAETKMVLLPLEYEKVAHRCNVHRELVEALDEAVKDLVAYQVNARQAALHNASWMGVANAVQPTIDKARAALARGE